MELISLRYTNVYNYLGPNEILDKIMELWLGDLNKYIPLKTKIDINNKNKWNFSKDCCQLMKASNKVKNLRT